MTRQRSVTGSWHLVGTGSPATEETFGGACRAQFVCSACGQG